MRQIELLAPARNADIGIAAIDCGADAVYIAGPEFGARKDAGNPISEIERLCRYASKFGARVFVTFNILLHDDELESAHAQMLLCQSAGASAFIIRDPRLCLFSDITIPLHASTQCSIRDVQRARLFEKAGCGRVVLERELDLAQIREICNGVNVEVEAFVHGALCVCYSGVCTLSERLTGRSADRGECIQACRNLYDLVDDSGRVWLKNKALLSLKDLNLSRQLESLLDAGVTSLKIEGRLKNISYVRNVVRAYSLCLDEIIARHPGLYRRASWGRVERGFTPSLDKTFNRGYTSLLLGNTDSSLANFDAPKSMGERLGKVRAVRVLANSELELTLDGAALELRNGDGFAFVRGEQIVGFRGDVCSGNKIICKKVQGLSVGAVLYRNYSVAFESEMELHPCKRFLSVALDYRSSEKDGMLDVTFSAQSEDGRKAEVSLSGLEKALNRQRESEVYAAQLEKHSSVFSFALNPIGVECELAHLSMSALNGVRRSLSDALESQPCGEIPMLNPSEREPVEYDTTRREGEVMRSKYCIRREISQCLKSGGRKGALYLENNGRRFPLRFDCSACEMAVLEE